MSADAPRGVERWVAWSLAFGYLGLLAFAVLAPVTPRIFWTVIMPLVPLFVVVVGFHPWRRLCPIATLGSLGAHVHARGRRLPRSWRERGVTVAFVALLATLSLRLVATNGDGLALALFLGALALSAVVVNAWGGGRSFCHHACPVGLVERIYTDGAPSLESARAERGGAGPSSGCAPCTGCTSACVDLQSDRAARRDVGDDRRRDVTYAFPGVVLAFYAYYALRAGTWEAYFDGRWTQAPASLELAFGPGFFFARDLPAIIAAPLTLVAFGLASHALFMALERIVPLAESATAPPTDTETTPLAVAAKGARGESMDPGRVRRERVLALASFAAFNVFYLFAGAPTLRLVPGLSRVVAFVIPVIATLVLVHRLRRVGRGVEASHGVREATAASASSVAVRPSVPSSKGTRRRLPVVAA